MSDNNWGLFTDGGSRGNPGPAAFGYHLIAPDGRSFKGHGLLGIQTNNFAEYQGILNGLRAALDMGAEALEVYCDSQLVVEQLNGNFKIKHPNIKLLADEAKRLMGEFPGAISIHHVRRELNKVADGLVNRALDGAGN